jgi:hypothetical protein
MFIRLSEITSGKHYATQRDDHRPSLGHALMAFNCS